MSGNQRNLDKSHYQYFEPHYYIWLGHHDLKHLHDNNFTSECTFKGVEYIKIRYDSNVLIDNSGEPHTLGESRTHLFSMTNMNFWTYNHKKLFL